MQKLSSKATIIILSIAVLLLAGYILLYKSNPVDWNNPVKLENKGNVSSENAKNVYNSVYNQAENEEKSADVGMKTYVSKKLGVSVIYPENWPVNDKMSSECDVRGNGCEIMFGGVPSGPSPDKIDLTQNIYLRVNWVGGTTAGKIMDDSYESCSEIGTLELEYGRAEINECLGIDDAIVKVYSIYNHGYEYSFIQTASAYGYKVSDKNIAIIEQMVKSAKFFE